MTCRLLQIFRCILGLSTNPKESPMKPALDLSSFQAPAQALLDAAYAAGQADGAAPASGVSADQEAADIAAAVKPFQDQIAALQADDQAKADLATGLQATVDKIKALLA